MARLSEAQLDVLGIDLCAEVNMAASEFNAGEADDAETNEMLAGIGELIRGYRRAAALEDMLQEWVAEDSEREPSEDRWGQCCQRCGKLSTEDSHDDDCLIAKAVALLAEGDE